MKKKANKTEIVLIIDRSGSMATVKTEVIGAVNGFIDQQKAVPGECAFTLVQFDSVDPYETIYNRVDINDAKHITKETYVPRGNTPLCDAVGRGISSLRAVIDTMKKKDRPDSVIFVVQTDGQENSSKEFNANIIKEMIARETKNGWSFLYLGAGMESIQQSKSMGFAAGSSMAYSGSGASTQNAILRSSMAVVNSRVTGQVAAYSPEDRRVVDASDTNS